MTAHGKRTILSEFLGLSVRLDPSSEESLFKFYSTSPKIQSFCPERNARDIAVARPEESVVLTFVLDRSQGVYAHTSFCPDHLFCVHAGWRCFLELFGPDSVVHGLAYRSRNNETVVGIFDASRLGGAQLHELAFLDRHKMVFDLFRGNAHNNSLQYHWAGFAPSCYNSLWNSPFRCHEMLILRQDFSTERVIGPLKI